MVISASGELQVAGLIKADGGISSSNQVSFTGLPTTPVGLPSGSLYTLSGSQVGISASFAGNITKLVLIK